MVVGYPLVGIHWYFRVATAEGQGNSRCGKSKDGARLDRTQLSVCLAIDAYKKLFNGWCSNY